MCAECLVRGRFRIVPRRDRCPDGLPFLYKRILDGNTLSSIYKAEFGLTIICPSDNVSVLITPALVLADVFSSA